MRRSSGSARSAARTESGQGAGLAGGGGVHDARFGSCLKVDRGGRVARGGRGDRAPRDQHLAVGSRDPQVQRRLGQAGNFPDRSVRVLRGQPSADVRQVRERPRAGRGTRLDARERAAPGDALQRQLQVSAAGRAERVHVDDEAAGRGALDEAQARGHLADGGGGELLLEDVFRQDHARRRTGLARVDDLCDERRAAGRAARGARRAGELEARAAAERGAAAGRGGEERVARRGGEGALGGELGEGEGAVAARALDERAGGLAGRGGRLCGRVEGGGGNPAGGMGAARRPAGAHASRTRGTRAQGACAPKKATCPSIQPLSGAPAAAAAAAASSPARAMRRIGSRFTGPYK